MAASLPAERLLLRTETIPPVRKWDDARSDETAQYMRVQANSAKTNIAGLFVDRSRGTGEAHKRQAMAGHTYSYDGLMEIVSPSSCL